MIAKITINERLKDLRNNKNLTLEELAKETGISSKSLDNFERDDYLVRHDAIIQLANYYGVSTDYLLGITDCPDSVDTPISKLHLSDKAIERICSDQINSVLLSEIIENDAFYQLMIDSEVYVNGFVEEYTAQHDLALKVARKRIMERHGDIKDATTEMLDYNNNIHKLYLGNTLADDMVKILDDIKNKHRGDTDTSDGFNPDQMIDAIQKEAQKDQKGGLRGLAISIMKQLKIYKSPKNIDSMTKLLESKEPTEEQFVNALSQSSIIVPDKQEQRKNRE